MSGSFLALFDDLAAVLDDVAAMTKLAAKKTAGVLGDDLALNAEQLRGLQASREAPVVLAVARGSFKNKLILVPLALAVSELAPWAIGPLLVLGGLFLCYEGVEKLVHRSPSATDAAPSDDGAASGSGVAQARTEASKIKDAVRTDFVLSAEIIVITLGTLGSRTFGSRLAVLAAVAVLMTLGVYGVVLAVLKLDDLGLLLMRQRGAVQRVLGRGLVQSAPWLMRLLGVVGTAAVFLVGGGIVVHGITPLNSAIQMLLNEWPRLWLWSPLLEGLSGVVSGGIMVIFVAMGRRLRALF